MAETKTLTSIINNLRENLRKLRILSKSTQEDFAADFTKVESTKHLMQVSVQCCIDIAHHVVANEGFRTPKDSYDAFVVLQEADILPADFMPTLRQMVSFRNRVVHLYWEVNEAPLYEILQNNLQDLTNLSILCLNLQTRRASGRSCASSSPSLAAVVTFSPSCL